MTDTRNGFAKRVKSRRLGAGLTQRQLSEQSGVNYETLRKLESGHVKPTLEKAIKLSRALNVSLLVLAGVTEIPQANNGACLSMIHGDKVFKTKLIPRGNIYIGVGETPKTQITTNHSLL